MKRKADQKGQKTGLITLQLGAEISKVKTCVYVSR